MVLEKMKVWKVYNIEDNNANADPDNGPSAQVSDIKRNAYWNSESEIKSELVISLMARVQLGFYTEICHDLDRRLKAITKHHFLGYVLASWKRWFCGKL